MSAAHASPPSPWPALRGLALGAAMLWSAAWLGLAQAQEAPLSRLSAAEFAIRLAAGADTRAFRPTQAPDRTTHLCPGAHGGATMGAGTRNLLAVGYASEGAAHVDLDVGFAYASDELTPRSRELLDQLAIALKDPLLSGSSFAVAGHTDARGDRTINLQLSCARAIAVRNYLIQRGVEPERLAAHGFGSDMPLYAGQPEDARNRRVEIRRAQMAKAPAVMVPAGNTGSLPAPLPATPPNAGNSAGRPAQPENHALIMWLQEYADSRSNLLGIAKDAAMAKSMAALVRVPSANIVELSNKQLTLGGIRQAFASLHARVRDGDRVFIYFSGHGGQLPNPDYGKSSGNRCSEGLVSYDGLLYFDRQLQQELDRLAERSSQVLFLNDACYAGGTASRAMGMMDADHLPKAYPGQIKGGSANDAGYQCGDAINGSHRSVPGPGRQHSPPLFYLAASADNEVSTATSKGSVATLAWAECMQALLPNGSSGGPMPSGRDLAQCAQRRIDRDAPRPQTLTPVGNGQLPLALVARRERP